MDHVPPRRVAAALSVPAFRYRNYRLYWFGQLVSLSGTWMQNVGQAWLVLTLTNSALALGVVSALQFTPVLFLGLWGGVIADRIPKRRLLLITQSCAMLLAVIFGALAGSGLIRVWHIYVLAALLGTVTAVDNPTRQAFVGELVAKEDLGSAIAMNSSLFNAARIVGPALGGILIGWLGVPPLFWLNAVSFIAVIAALSAMRLEGVTPATPRGSMASQLVAGLHYVRQTPVILLIMLLIAFIGTFGMNFNVLIPLLARNVLHRGATGYGFLMAAMGLGSLISAVSLAVGGRVLRLGRMIWAALVFALLQVAVAYSTLYALSLALLLLVGLGSVQFTATANTVVQLRTPPELRGRVMSMYVTFFLGTTPLGSLVIGILAHRYGASVAMATGGIISALAACYGLLVWRRLAERERAGEPAPMTPGKQLAADD